MTARPDYFPQEFWSSIVDEDVLPCPVGVTVAELAAGAHRPIPRGIRYLEVIDDGGTPFTYRIDGASGNALPARRGDFIRVVSGGTIRLEQGSAAPASALSLIGWSKSDATIRAMSRGLMQVVNNAGKASNPTGHNTPARLALAATAASYTPPSGTISSIVRAAAANAAAAYVSDTDAAVAVATTRDEYMQADWKQIYYGDSTTWSYLGTSGDFLYVWNYKG